MRLLPIALIATAILAVGAILAIWLAVRGSPAQPPSTPQTTSVSTEPPVGDILQKALKAFEAEDYVTAERQAGDVLARDPGNDAAQRLRDRARTAAAAVDSGLKKARAFVATGRHEEASRAAGEVLSVAPGNSEAKRIMEDGAAQSQGRGAQEARSQVARAKAAARSAGAQQLASASYAAAIAAERDAQRLSDGGRPGDATVKFYEASGLFRSAEVAAQNESAAREARARAAAEQAERKPAPEPLPPATTSTPPATTLPSPSVKTEPVPIPAAPAPPPVTLPSAPPPTVPAAPPAEKPAPGPEVAIGELLAQYKSALESRNLDALKRLWPGLGGAPQEAIRNEFGHASQIRVEIVDPHISVSGATGTVTFLRRYDLVTVEGRQLRSQSRTTMDVRRSGNGWFIERIRFEPVR